MPIGAGGAAAIGAAATILGNTGTAYAQGKQNRKTRKWNEKMHALVREESLSDWAMQNEYNSPRAQMERYRDAGLNPNLIYGQSNEAPAVRSSDVQSWNPRSPDFKVDAPQMLSSFMDARLKEATMDNLTTQNTVLAQEAILKAAQTANLGTQTAKSQFDLQLATELKATTLEAAQANLNKITTETSISLQKNERDAALNATSISEAAERILSIRQSRAKTAEEIENVKAERTRIHAAIKNMEKDTELKALDINLKKDGLQPSDNLVWRILGQLFDVKDLKNIPSPTDWWKLPHGKFKNRKE